MVDWFNVRNSGFLHLLSVNNKLTKEQSKNNLFFNRFSPRTHSHSFSYTSQNRRDRQRSWSRDKRSRTSCQPIERLIRACGEKRTGFEIEWNSPRRGGEDYFWMYPSFQADRKHLHCLGLGPVWPLHFILFIFLCILLLKWLWLKKLQSFQTMYSIVFVYMFVVRSYSCTFYVQWNFNYPN